MDQGKFKTRPSSFLFQIARGSGATLRTLEITKSVKATVYTGLFYTTKAKARQELNRSRNNVQSCSHGKVESKTKYSASQITLIAWTTHPKNKQGIQVERTSAKKSSFKRKYNVILQGTSIEVNYVKRHHQGKR